MGLSKVKKTTSFTKLKVGFTSIVGIIILFGGILWIKNTNPLVNKVKITVLFNDACGITIGDPVTISGIKIGEINRVYLDKSNKALVDFLIDEDIKLHTDCTFTIKDVGLMGDKVLVIRNGTATGFIDPDNIQEGTESFDLTDLFDGARKVIEKLDLINTKIEEDLDLKKLTDSFEQTFNKMQEAITIYEEIARENSEPLKRSINSFEESTIEIREFINRNDKRLGNAVKSFERTSEKIYSSLETVENLSTVADTVSAYIKSGDGTFSKLIKSEIFYEELRQTNANLDSLISDFKRDPGKYTKDMKFKIRLF